jgi:AcrR family transcriptional regulator
MVAAARGRVDKREAILDAALAVFVREGYERASIDAIALEAGVSKPTVYAHLGSKEELFRTVMIGSADRSSAKILELLQTFPTTGRGLRDRLVDVGYQVIDCQRSADGWALQRLLYAEAARFPDLFDTVVAHGGSKVTDALAGRLARLAHAGHLNLDDPMVAAAQFTALVSGDLPYLSALGTRDVSDKDLRRAVTAGVDTFLRAFGT